MQNVPASIAARLAEVSMLRSEYLDSVSTDVSGQFGELVLDWLEERARADLDETDWAWAVIHARNSLHNMRRGMPD